MVTESVKYILVINNTKQYCVGTKYNNMVGFSHNSTVGDFVQAMTFCTLDETGYL